MSTDDVRTAIRMMSALDAPYPFRPQPTTLVEEAERLLGLKFPPTYRQFLLEVGTGGFGPYEIYGITGSDLHAVGGPNGIWLTLDSRIKDDLPHSFVIVTDSGMGEYYCLDTSVDSGEGECPVVMWLHRDAEIVTVGSDFGSFLLCKLTEYLTY